MNVRSGPLSNVRGLAISQFGAGPFATLLLSDLGAEVIKIEDPESFGDVARSVPPYAYDGDSTYSWGLKKFSDPNWLPETCQNMAAFIGYTDNTTTGYSRIKR